MKKSASYIIAVLLLISSLVLASCGTPPSFSTLTPENPMRTVESFIDAIQTGDYDTAEAYVANYTTLGFDAIDDIPHTSSDWKLYEALFDSYEVRFYSDCGDTVSIPYSDNGIVINGRQAVITFSFTSLDFEKMSADLKTAISELGAERMYHGETYETEEDALQLVDDAYEMAFGDDLSDYYTERDITINAWLTEDGWKLEISEEFYSALIGR